MLVNFLMREKKSAKQKDIVRMDLSLLVVFEVPVDGQNCGPVSRQNLMVGAYL